MRCLVFLVDRWGLWLLFLLFVLWLLCLMLYLVFLVVLWHLWDLFDLRLHLSQLVRNRVYRYWQMFRYALNN
jgi:hypothetical protein